MMIASAGISVSAVPDFTVTKLQLQLQKLQSQVKTLSEREPSCKTRHVIITESKQENQHEGHK